MTTEYIMTRTRAGNALDLAFDSETRQFTWQGNAIDASATGIYNVCEFGAIADGTTDNGPAFNAASAAAEATGGTIVIPPAADADRYHIKSQWFLNVVDRKRVEIVAYGSQITTEGSGGTHTGSNNASVLTDGTKSFTTDEFVGLTIYNTTDGSSGTVTANTGTTITATLSGGTDNDWDTTDIYIVGAGSAIDIKGGGNLGGVTVRGMYVNHDGNLNATAGIHVNGAGHCNFYDCTVRLGALADRFVADYQNDYGAYRITQSDPSNISTGAFHNTFYGCDTRSLSGTYELAAPNGYLLEGSVNATGIYNASVGNVRNGVKIKQNGVVDFVTNALLVMGCKFEGVNYGVTLDPSAVGASTQDRVPNGVRIIGCRSEVVGPTATINAITQANPAVVTIDDHHKFEDGDTITISGIVGMTELNDREFTVANSTATTFELQGEDSTGHTAYTSDGEAQSGAFLYLLAASNEAPVYPYLAGNMLVSDTRTYTQLEGSFTKINSLDMSLTPKLIPSIESSLTLTSQAGADNVLTVKSTGGGRGIRVQPESAASDAVGIYWMSGTASNNTIGQIRGRNTGLLEIIGVKSISETLTTGSNLRGTVTLSSGTASVSFGTNEPDASYFIALGGDTAGESYGWATKATTGFTINSSNGSSTANVDWILIR